MGSFLESGPVYQLRWSGLYRKLRIVVLHTLKFFSGTETKSMVFNYLRCCGNIDDTWCQTLRGILWGSHKSYFQERILLDLISYSCTISVEVEIDDTHVFFNTINMVAETSWRWVGDHLNSDGGIYLWTGCCWLLCFWNKLRRRGLWWRHDDALRGNGTLGVTHAQNFFSYINITISFYHLDHFVHH